MLSNRKFPGSFPIQQSVFAFHAPGISGNRPVVADHAVARNGDRQFVRRTSAGDCAHRLGSPDPLRELGIGDRRTGGDFPKRLPDPLLEGGAADVERQIKTDLCFWSERD